MNREQIFTKVLDEGSISTVFQPIVSLKTGIILGYEALSRIPFKPSDATIGDMFQIASTQDRLWDLEKLCRIRALQNASTQPSQCFLFLNVDTSIMHDPKFRAGFTVEKLREYNIVPERVIIELTEQSFIVDMSDFVCTVQHYQNQGFKIAIDDFGSGFSGLTRVCEISPEFLKIDMQLVRDIHKDPMKRSAVNSTVEFCRKAGIRVIAEGIETEEELKTLMRLGVEFGQGFYLLRPDPSFQEIPGMLNQKIREIWRNISTYPQSSILGKIGDLGNSKTAVYGNHAARSLYNLMVKDQECNEFMIIDDQDQVCGILTRQNLFEKFSGLYGYALGGKMSAEDIMANDVLIVDKNTPIEVVSDLAMKRTNKSVYDSVAVTYDGKYLCSVSIKELLLSSINLQLQRATDANPLTCLPGNHEIQRVIEDTFRRYEPWSIIYLDIDNFKAYNDAYGFPNGDNMLKILADSMRNCTSEFDFVGHIGGDDFFILSNTHDVAEMCWRIVSDFKANIESLYSCTDWNQKSFLSLDRNGFTQTFKIATLSIAVVSNEFYQPQTIEELSTLIAQTKKKCKIQQGDCVIMI